MRALAAILLILATIGCVDRQPEHHPFIVIGVDGAELSVVRQLWDEGRLPHLRALAERGTVGTLRTRYAKSPMIWTSIATGVTAERHGITDFVIPTDSGDVPVSSSLRKAPAIWNMLSTAGRQVAVLCWWASWPAEPVNGIVVSDRILKVPDDSLWPESWAGNLERLIAQSGESDSDLFGPKGRRDRLVDAVARELARTGEYDLLLAYFNTVDPISHLYWKYFRTQRFEPLDPEEVSAHADRIPSIYEDVDRSVGGIVEAGGPNVNYLVLSDHGFQSARQEIVRVPVDMDRVLERLGYLGRTPTGGVDFSTTRLFVYSSAPFLRIKNVRYALAGREPGGQVEERDQERLRRQLTQDLATIRYTSGEPVFLVRDSTSRTRKAGADFVVEILREGATPETLRSGQPFPVVVGPIQRISGAHGSKTHGLLIAAGPDIARDADLEGLRIFDVTPTLLYGLGLPTAEDFDGRPWTALFTEEFRRAHPVETIASWGTRDATEALTSVADEELLEELRALGYLD